MNILKLFTMKIKKIEIENYRGFKGKHEVSFQPDINVFVGTNGSGKSSILDLIACFIDTVLEDVHRDFQTYRLTPYDINLDATNTKNKVYFIDKDNLIKPEYLSFLLEFDRFSDSQSKVSIREYNPPFIQPLEVIVNKRLNIPIFRYFCIESLKSETANGEAQNQESTYIQTSVYKKFYSSRNNFKDFISFPTLGEKKLVYKHPVPLEHKYLITNKNTILQTAMTKDILLHYPYHTFNHIINLLREASIDPIVESIKITLYRMADASRIANALVNAVKNGKKVTEDLFYHNSFLNLATGISNCSLYFATVLLAILYPRLRKSSINS